MKQFLYALLVLVCTHVSGNPHVSSTEGFAPIVKPLLGSVVSIATTQKQKKNLEGLGIPPEVEEALKRLRPSLADEINGKPRGPKRNARKAYALGSGFVVEYDAAKKEAYIVTNDHLIENSSEITIHLKDEEGTDSEIKAKLIGRDPRTDLALVKIKTDIALPALEWGNSDTIHVGEWAIAIGNPFGLGNTVTVGVVSHHGRDIPHADYVNGFIQTDAPLNTGNSGGPLFNVKGQVIGVNVGRIVPGMGDGVGFAIPANIAKKTIEQLRKFGSTKRGWIGIGFQSITKDMMKALDLPNTKGALIGSIAPGGPAEKAGLKRMDVVIRFGKHKVKDIRTLPQLVGEMEVGSSVEIEVLRDGKSVVAQITLGEFEKAQKDGKIDGPKNDSDNMDKQKSSKSRVVLGMKLSDITDAAIKEYDLGPNAKGVLVIDVDIGSEAFEVGLRPGDVIEAVNVRVLKNVKDLRQVIKSLKSKHQTTILLSIRRHGKEMPFVTLSLEDEDKKKDDDNKAQAADKTKEEE